MNGLTAIGRTSPVLVIANALAELSMSVEFWQVNRDVFAIAVRGVVDGVNVDVYKAVPFTIRKLDTDPKIPRDVPVFCVLPNKTGSAFEFTVPAFDAGVPLDVPLTYTVKVEPLRTHAICDHVFKDNNAEVVTFMNDPPIYASNVTPPEEFIKIFQFDAALESLFCAAIAL